MWKKILVILLALLLLVTPATRADECADKSVEEKVSCYENKIKESQGQQKTLASTIDYLNNKIALTLSEIEQKETEIKSLEEEIATLSVKIGRLDVSLGDVSELLISRVGAAYKRSLFKPIFMLFSSSGLTDFFERNKYLQVAQLNDRKILLELQTSRDLHQEQKSLKQQKQDELEALKTQLSNQKVALGGQKQEKQNLLSVTKNDESRYQQLLAVARSAQQAQALSLLFQDGKAYITYSINNLAKHGQVSAGARIGTMGNSGSPGCSTGSHLHLEYLSDAKIEDNKLKGTIVNPIDSLQNKSVQWFNDKNQMLSINIGGGSNAWPMNDPVITQMFGQTPYSARYRYNFHTGFDMVDLDNYAIKAIRGGTLYTGTLVCNSGSSLINVAIIDHGGGIFSNYLHLK